MSATPPNSDKSVGEIVSEVSEKASLLVREEIELAKAEVTGKVKTLGKGAAVGAAAGVFLFFAFVIFLVHAVLVLRRPAQHRACDLARLPGITTLILVLLAVIAGLLAKKWLSSGPPTPDMAIEEAKATRDQFEHQTIERDQVTRSLERDKETTES